jgi:hypothetical protein
MEETVRITKQGKGTRIGETAPPTSKGNAEAKVLITNIKTNYTEFHYGDTVEYYQDSLTVEAKVTLKDGRVITGAYPITEQVFDFLGIREIIAKMHNCKLANVL